MSKYKNLRFFKILILFFIFVLYDVFVINQPQSFFKNIFEIRFLVNYLVSIACLICFLLIIDILFKGKILSKIVAIFLLFIPLAVQTISYSFYNEPLNSFGIISFFSDPVTILNLGVENINVAKIILFLLLFLFILSIFLFDKKEILYKKLKIKIYSFFFLLFLFFCGANWYFIFNYQTAVISAYASAVPGIIRHSFFKEKRMKKIPVNIAESREKMPNILWIIGESVSKRHMSLYGYKRKTTPKLDELKKLGVLIPFENVISIGSHTIISVPYMMVGLQRIDPKGLFYSVPNIFEYAKARRYHTAFIGAQDLRWRNFDQFVGGEGLVDHFRSGTDFSPRVNVSKGIDDLKVLNEDIVPYLTKTQEPFLLVAHMDGSHAPYQTHSEKQYKKFFPEDDPNGINAYDNTLVYSDVYLEKLISTARKKDPNIWIFYSTDHGQSIPLPEEEYRGIYFNQGYSQDIIQNAFFVVPPESAKKSILLNKHAPVAQADIFATILDLMDIKKPVTQIDGMSLLKKIPHDRLRVSTGFVVTNDNVPDADVIYPDLSSVHIDFDRGSLTLSDGKTVVPLKKAPFEIQSLFKGYIK